MSACVDLKNNSTCNSSGFLLSVATNKVTETKSLVKSTNNNNFLLEKNRNNAGEFIIVSNSHVITRYLLNANKGTKGILTHLEMVESVDGGENVTSIETTPEETVEQQTDKGRNIISDWVYTLISNLKQKVGAPMMAVQIPTPLIIYREELSESFKDGLYLKLAFASVFTFVISLTGLTVEQLIASFIFYFLLVAIDSVLALIPGNVKEGTEKDHKLSAKLIMFVTNTLGIIAAFAGHIFLSSLIPEPNMIQVIGVNFHYAVVGWVVSLYVYRIIVYMGRANNAKIPFGLSKYFNK